MVEHRCVLVCRNENQYSARGFVSDAQLARSFVATLGVTGESERN
jgi:hypothetical protein